MTSLSQRSRKPLTAISHGRAKLTGPVLYVTADDQNGEVDFDAELSECVMAAAEDIYRQMPDALPPEVLAAEIAARRAILVVLESTDGAHIGGVAIGTRRVRDGIPCLIVHVDVWGGVNIGFNFAALFETAALCRGIGAISIRSNGRLPMLPGYSYECLGGGFYMMTLDLTIQ